RASRRRRLLAAVATLVVVTWAGVTLTDRLGRGSPSGSHPASVSAGVPATPGEPLARGGPPGPTYPPDVEVLQPLPLGHLPIVLDGLAWLDPARGKLQSEQAFGSSQWRFAL